MKILFTGKADFSYNRVQVLLAGLNQLKDVEVELFPIKSRKTFDKKAFIKLQESVDFIYIPPFRHRDVKFIKRLSTKPIVFDPLISKFSTKVLDYGQFWKAPFRYLNDKVAFSNSDLLIADTYEHKKYFSKTFNLDSKKIGVVPVGVDTTLFYSTPAQSNKQVFKVGCYATFVPLQGMPIIIRAAKLLKEKKDIEFYIIGNGYQYNKVKRYANKHDLTNVKFLGWIDYEKLNDAINEFDVCLGIFGNSAKANAVIPNKVFHYAALGKCIISKDTPGIRELFTSRKDMILCQNTPEDLAESIQGIKQNNTLRTNIGQNAKQLITLNYSHIQIAESFVDFLKNSSST